MSVHADLAARLAAARASGVPIAPPRHDHPALGLADAYRVQDLATAARRAAGGQTIGRKIGLTSTAVQRQFGVDEPDSGWLWADCRFCGGDTIARPLIAPRVEGEIALVLGRDVDDPADAAGAVDHFMPALEIVDSAIAGWDVRLFDTVADNASGWGVVLGEPVRGVPLHGLADLTMALARNGVVESRGIGGATMGGPLAALGWLAHHADGRGQPLRAGEIIMTGALGPVLPARPGDAFTLEIAGCAPVSISFADATGRHEAPQG
ncbi:2-keto-4-pentenoate hydratase [Sphingomonas sp. OV641]|uniref:2-keto-4-pentenoate hydratase n=1 Tax=Sphingomonas sp. OV641 TaxID=1881068 RepID=UPI0008B89F41|nr:fumarylacetoacetate hydrolase family protein [Sphingomonas sp. OV641]SEJ87689.1 2-keto-4-pentenoate hydratase [Sphingomonas sp. OV641]